MTLIPLERKEPILKEANLAESYLGRNSSKPQHYQAHVKHLVNVAGRGIPGTKKALDRIIC